jgi:sugar phosphate permease
MAYTVGMAAALLALQATPAGAQTLQWIAIAALGFTIYGPQMLIGLSGAELVSPGAVGASQGILGWIAYLGAANAGAQGRAVRSSGLFWFELALSWSCWNVVLAGSMLCASRACCCAPSSAVMRQLTGHSLIRVFVLLHCAGVFTAAAGIPLAHVVQNHGWGGFFTALLGACGAALALLTLVANAPSHQQREAAKPKAA